MKLFLVIALAVTSYSAVARERLSDGALDSPKIEWIKFSGRPQTETKAALVKVAGSDDLSLVIVETDTMGRTLVVDNSKLNLTVRKSGSTRPKLSMNSWGALQITTDNTQFPSRDQWSRTLGVSYKKGTYIVSNFKLDYLDTRTGLMERCEYDLIRKSGSHNNSLVRAASRPLNVANVEDLEKFYSCTGW